MTTPRLLALSDLHAAHPQNREIAAGLRPGGDGDWLLLADEALLHADPYDSREERCRARIGATERRLAGRDPALPVVFVTHYPLLREPTRVLRYPLFAQWCGTTWTSDWHLRFNAAAVVYGHLHIPRVTWHHGVRFEEVSLGYPREWRRRDAPPGVPRQILPDPRVTRRP
jgi:hypothetical protein